MLIKIVLGCFITGLLYGAQKPVDGLPQTQHSKICSLIVLPQGALNSVNPAIAIHQLIGEYLDASTAAIKTQKEILYDNIFGGEDVSVDLAYSADGKYIFVSSQYAKDQQEKIICWDRKKENSIIIEEHRASSCISCAKDGPYLLQSRVDGEAHQTFIKSTDSFKIIDSLSERSDTIFHFMKGTELFGLKARKVFIYDFKTRTCKFLNIPENFYIRCFGAGCNHVIGESGKSLLIWDITRNKIIANISCGPCGTIKYSPNGLYLAIFTRSNHINYDVGEINIYSTKQNYEKIATVPIKIDKGVGFLEFSPDDKELFISSCFVYSGIDHAFHIYNIEKSEIIYKHIIPGKQAITGVAYSPDGLELCVGLRDRLLLFRDLTGAKKANK